MGSNGKIPYRTGQIPIRMIGGVKVGGSYIMEDGWHIHINAMKKWWKGAFVRGGKHPTAHFIPKLERKLVKLSSLCPE